MVPGVFKQVNPCLIANPLLGLTCASKCSGISKNKPVGTKTLSNGTIIMGCSRWALISTPDEPAVAYAGNACGLLLTILTVVDMFNKSRYNLEKKLRSRR
jgi:hypothetical protein